MRLLLLLFVLVALLPLSSQAQLPMFEGAQAAAWSAGQHLQNKNLLPMRKISQWRFNAGLSYRSLRGTSWKTDSSFNLSDFAPTAVHPGPAGLASGNDHRYRDGYVHPDIGTSIDGHTAFFGYDNSSQVQGTILSFHGDGGTLSTFSNTSPDADGDAYLNGFAPSFQATWMAREFAHAQEVLRAGLTADLTLLATDADRTVLTQDGIWNRYRLSVTDHYTVNPGTLPPAPYRGDNSGIGPVIVATPDGRTTAAQLINSKHYQTFAHQSLHLLLTAVSIGPTFEWEHAQRFAIQTSMGLALNFASWTASQSEGVSVDHRLLATVEHHESGLRLLPGLYAQVTAKVRISNAWWLNGFGRYDWCGGIEGDVGPSHFHAVLGGWTAGIAAERHY